MLNFLIGGCDNYRQEYTYRPSKRIMEFTSYKGTFKINEIVYIDGRDLKAQPPLTIISVNIWSTPNSNRKKVCNLSHGDEVQIIEISSDEIYVKIKAMFCEGWLMKEMIGKQIVKPVGDIL